MLALPRNLRQLTIVLAVTEKRKPSRLFVISSFDRPGWPPLGNTLEHLAAYEIPSDKPRAFIFGFKSAVSRADRKLLKNLSRSACDASGIRAALSGINRVAGR